MNMPGFNAEMTLYRTNRHYQLTTVFAADIGGRVFSAVLKGTTCSVPDPNCPSGFSNLFCPSFDPDSCIETGVCCTKSGGGGGGGGPNCGTHSCPPGHPCCAFGCCPPGKFCCNDEGCCPAGTKCRRICVPFIGCSPSFCSPV
jgi:hypothetical protein